MRMRIAGVSKGRAGLSLGPVMVVVSMLGLGACTGRQQLPPEEQATKPKCADGGMGVDEATFTLQASGLVPSGVCLKKNATLNFTSTCGDVDLTVDAGLKENPFHGGELSFRVPGDGGTHVKRIKAAATNGAYGLSGECRGFAGPDAGPEIVPLNGTLEVATSTETQDG
ncbi:hypothetical protein [Pyxidicoccus xibeiensis]|uniref:hypothetical protein n=1 Tax=Pyxidicoccus xibeiensis TaxID=2906759 RepID=UPI0020A7271C|nr:hypothetical protein [Pyxidicoccus xibeiensis]MCP3145180.1 hypothetical protein [Pyxidicoccus xibeiensis]